MKIIKSKQASQPLGHYSQAYEHNGIIYISTQIGTTPKTQNISIEKQVIKIFESLKNILKEANSDLSHILKITIYISDIKYWDDVDSIYKEIMKDNKPPRGVIACNKLHCNADVAFDITAAVI